MKYATFDIEANDWIRFECLGLFDGQEFKLFDNVKKFLSYVDRKGYDGWRFYAHNGGKYDFLFLLDEIFQRSWKVRIIERQGRIIALRVNGSRVTFMFADSYALLTDGLKKLTETFRVEHQKTDFDFEEKISRKSGKLLRYLENDCRGLYEVLGKFFENEYIVQPQLTIASQAMNTFRTKFFDGELVRISDAKEEVFREHFYSGGRVEVYKGEGKDLFEYDVNSLYPTAMLEEMPCGDMETVRTFRKGQIGFYHVKIKETPDWYISPLLVKRDKNFYVNGAGEYFLGSCTLEMLREYGVKFSVIQGFAFKRKEHLFTDYVQTFYNLKVSHRNDSYYEIAKKMLNALYGKFGQSRWRQEYVPYSYGLESTTSDEFLDSYCLCLVERKSHNKFILPYIAAWITELARLYHWKIMQESPREMFYCDTDSLVTSHLYQTDDEKIGALSLKAKWDRGVFLSSKSYALKNCSKEKVAFKGFPVEDYSYQDFDSALKTGKILNTDKLRMLSFRECLKRKNGIVRDEGRYLKMVISKKEVRTEYDKRFILPHDSYVFDSMPFFYRDIAT